MDKARKQRLLGVLALVVLFGAYVGWSERPRILLHYSGQASAPIAYSYKEQGVETFSGEIRPGQVREFPVKLFGGSDYRIDLPGVAGGSDSEYVEPLLDSGVCSNTA